MVFVVDDDPAIRTILKRVLEGRKYNARAFASAAEFLEYQRPDMPQCIVLDSQMPGMNGLDVQEALGRKGDTTPILFLTGHADVPLAVRALTRGAMDFMQKPVEPEELIYRVNSALERDQTTRQNARSLENWRKRFETLSARERDVLGEMVGGHPNKIIADNLGIAIKTVEIHRSRVMDKMEADSLASLVREYFAARGGGPSGAPSGGA